MAHENYRQQGLIVAPVRLAADVRTTMQQSLEKLLAFRDDVAPESLICPHIPALGLGDDDAAIAIAAEWFGYATRPEILDCVEALLGPDIVLWGSQVFCKPARTGRKIPWHQDGKYWPMRPLATVSAWIAIDDATPENGNMRYLPGSHRDGRCSRIATTQTRGWCCPRRSCPRRLMNRWPVTTACAPASIRCMTCI